MPADEGIRFLLFVIEREEEALLFQRWLVGAQFSMSFEEFKHQLESKPLKSDEEIIADVESIMNEWDKKRNLVEGGG